MGLIQPPKLLTLLFLLMGLVKNKESVGQTGLTVLVIIASKGSK